MKQRDKLISAGVRPVLEARIKRDLAFGRWLEGLDLEDDPLVRELQQTLTMHRIAARNLLVELDPDWNGTK